MITVLIGKDGDNALEQVQVTGVKNISPIESFEGELTYNELSTKDKAVYEGFKSLFTNLKFGSISNSPYSFYAIFLTLTDSAEENINLDFNNLTDSDKKIVTDFYILLSGNKKLNSYI